jgi:exopolyphosphatase/guanosine-5'-triphosphate,3'-diphosphate pyrophosphatase
LPIRPAILTRSCSPTPISLELAALLSRGRTTDPLPSIRVQAEDKALRLELPASWLDQHPLTRADLEQEVSFFKILDLKLQVKSPERVAA